MSRITCKQCRRLGESLCGRDKCAFKKRPFAPGKLDSERKHKSSVSEYGTQMRKKQKVRFSYGVSENQFSKYVKNAIANKDQTITPADALVQSLESRLDNAVYRTGLSTNRALARQMVAHGHILVNGKRVKSSAHKLQIGDVIGIREGSKKSALFVHSHDKLKSVKSPNWLSVDSEKLEAKVTGKTKEKDLNGIFDLHAIIEFYSR